MSSYSKHRMDLVARVRVRRLYIDYYGKLVPGLSSNVNPEKPPIWYDRETFQRAQKLHRHYANLINFAGFYGLLLSLNLQFLQVVLLTTGNSSTVEKLFSRYLSTSMHVNSWYRDDPFDPESKAYRSLKLVRRMHRQAAKQVECGQFGCLELNYGINQWQMCHVHFSFIGLMAIFPKKLGFHCFKPKDFHALFHFWRVIGHCLGIDDQFNIYSGTNDEIIELCRQIYYESWLPTLQQSNERVSMCRGVHQSIEVFHYLGTYNSIMRYGAKFLDLDPELYPLTTFKDKINYLLLNVFMRYSSRFKWQNRMVTKISRLMVERGEAKQDYYRKFLQSKYSNIQFDFDNCIFDDRFKSICPFGGNVDNEIFNEESYVTKF